MGHLRKCRQRYVADLVDGAIGLHQIWILFFDLKQCAAQLIVFAIVQNRIGEYIIGIIVFFDGGDQRAHLCHDVIRADLEDVRNEKNPKPDFFLTSFSNNIYE